MSCDQDLAQASGEYIYDSCAEPRDPKKQKKYEKPARSRRSSGDGPIGAMAARNTRTGNSNWRGAIRDLRRPPSTCGATRLST